MQYKQSADRIIYTHITRFLLLITSVVGKKDLSVVDITKV